MNKLYYIVFMGLLTIASAGSLRAEADNVFTFESVRRMAEDLASKEYHPMDKELPKALQNLNYDDLRRISFDERASIWRMDRLPFQLQFFPRGGIRKEKIKVNVIDGSRVEAVSFSKNMFNYEQLRIKERRLDDDLGFNGFRINYPLNTIERLDELVVFQGASYFRALAKNLTYGLSARGLAINCGESTPEEFPEFIEFWVEKPDLEAEQIKMYALMDSPSLSGAYEMLIRPGADTVMDIHAMLYARKTVENLGLAPLTSMFWFGENSFSRFGDFRPEVHDSDGCLVSASSGEWSWRPLSNEGHLEVSNIADTNPKGFGLIQRDRDFSNYQDLETIYQMHPSAWVEPKGEWGAGEIRLVEIPTTTEYADNTVVFWVPAKPLTPEQPLEFAYRLHWMPSTPGRPSLSSVLNTWMGESAITTPKTRRFALDFSNAEGLDRNHPEQVEPVVYLRNATLRYKYIKVNWFNNTWRAYMGVEPDAVGQAVEVRCFLKSDETSRSETWIYSWIP